MSQIDDHYEQCDGSQCDRVGCPPDPYEVAMSDPEKGDALDQSALDRILRHFAESDPTGETVPVEGVALMAAVMQKSSDDLQWTNNQLIDGYKHERDQARAELAAIRDQIQDLLNGPYAPSSFALENALWPNQTLIDSYLSKGDY